MFNDEIKNGDSENKDTRGIKILKIAGMISMGVFVAILFAFIFGFVIKLLWNGLVPDVFGLSPISYWQAVGLFILIKLLTGNFYNNSSGNEDKIHRKIDRKIHNIVGVEYHNNNVHEKGYGCNKEYYNKFWREKGKDAFDAFITDLEKEKE